MADERMALELLESQLRQVRSWTRELIAGMPDEWMHRRVDWTDCTIAWHMGHLAWEQDVFADSAFGIGRRLGDDWERLFSAGSVVLEPEAYPPPERIRAAFSIALNRFLEQLGQTEDDTVLMRRRRGGPKTLLEQVLVLIYHEGEHASSIGTLIRCFAKADGVAIPGDSAGSPAADATPA